MSIEESNELIHASMATGSDEQRSWNQRILQPILYDLIALGRVLKQLHWNVVGSDFRSIHLHLDEIYTLVDAATDEVAERLAANGHSPNGRMCDVKANSEIEDVPEGFMRDKEVLLLSQHAVRRTIGSIRFRTAEFEDMDLATADMLYKLALSLEKHHWMLEAQRI